MRIKLSIILIGLAGAGGCGGCSNGRVDGEHVSINASSQAASDSFSQTQLPDSGPCDPIATEPYLSADGFRSDEYRWYDSACNVRRADMVRNTIRDPVGHWGGYVHRYTYQVSGQDRQCIGTTTDHPGFGIVVNHTSRGATDSLWYPGESSKPLFVGKHHAIHQYTTHYNIDDTPVQITIQWFFATGRDHPIWAITYDLSGAPANSIMADTRAPYGDIDWDGGMGAKVDGVGWGDHYKFTSLTSPVTLESGWDYSQPNTVPFVRAWSLAADGEIGIVQTQTFAQHDAGGYDFYSQWGNSNRSGPMPGQASWTYQLNQYELDGDLTSKRVAWGSNFGAVGQSQYATYGNARLAAGYPYQSYSTYVVFGTFKDNPTLAQVSQIETIQRTQFHDVQGGRLALQGPAGIARPDLQTYDPPGYEPIYGTWVLQRDNASVPLSFTITVAAGTLSTPLLQIQQWQGAHPPSAVSLNDTPLQADKDYFASIDLNHQTLWLTLKRDVVGSQTVVITP